MKAVGKKRPVTIVGAGFSGLVSAFYLSRAGFTVKVIESGNSPGGLIATVRTHFGLVETGANGLLNSTRVEELFAFMGLELTPTLKQARKRFIFRAGWPRRWPLGLIATFRVVWFFVCFFLLRNRVAPRVGESVRTWAERVLGREAAQYTVEAALQGIYAGDPARMSARLIFASFFNRPDRRSSQLAARPTVRGTVSAPDGMGELMLRLRERLEKHGVQFVFAQKQSRFLHEPLQPHVIATDAHSAGELLRALDPVRADALSAIELLPIVTATISFRDPPPEAQGFGCLFPPVEGRRALGVLMNNFIFPHRAIKGFCETWIFGGARADRDALLNLTDQEIVNLASEERQATLNATGEVIGHLVTRWPTALPHYTLELEKSLPELRGVRQNVILIGNYLGQIGLAKILDRAVVLAEELDAKGDWSRATHTESARP